MSGALGRPILLLGLLSAVLLAHAARYWPFLPDDALLSLRYAQRLGRGLGLTWATGERVEGYSNLLWVLLNASFGAFGADLIWTARALGFAGTLGALGVVSLSVTTLRPNVARILVGGSALVSSAPVAVWAIGGMEQPMMLGVLALALVLGMRALESPSRAMRTLLAVGALLAVLALLRIDGAVLALGMALGACIACPGRAGRRAGAIWAALPLASVCAHALFRRAYYGTWLPHTASVKVAFTRERFYEGLSYVWHGTHASVILLGLAALAVVLLRGRVPRARLVLPIAVACVWSAYVCSVGGDIFPGWRQLLVVLAPIALLLAEGAEQARSLRPRLTEWIVVALPPLAILHASLQDRDSENRRAHRESWVWDGGSVGDLLKRAFGPRRPLLAVDAAGALPYWSELESLDMLGLNDPEMVEHPPPGFGHGPIGHELGNGEYAWRRRPDLVVFANARGYARAPYRTGRELMEHPDFSDTYQLVRARTRRASPVTALVYVRRSDGPLAIERNAGRIEIPGYFMASATGSAVAELDSSDRLIAVVSAEHPGVVPRVEIAAGTWRMVTRPELPGGKLGVSCPGGTTADVGGRAFRLPRAMQVTLTAAPTSETTAGVESVVLEAASDASVSITCEVE